MRLAAFGCSLVTPHGTRNGHTDTMLHGSTWCRYIHIQDTFVSPATVPCTQQVLIGYISHVCADYISMIDFNFILHYFLALSLSNKVRLAAFGCSLVTPHGTQASSCDLVSVALTSAKESSQLTPHTQFALLHVLLLYVLCRVTGLL